jgi:hypothetical protein
MQIANPFSRRLVAFGAALLLTLASGLALISQSSPAEAASTALICGGDNTRICAPITNLKFTDRGAEVPIVTVGANSVATLSSDAKDLGGIFKTSADYAGKLVHIQFFDITKGMGFTVQAGAAGSTTACDPGPASGNGCYIKLDAAGSSTFNFSVSNVTATSKFSVQINGSAGWVSKAAVISFDTPTKITPSATRTATGISGKSVSLGYILTDKAGAALAGATVSVSTSGVGTLSATTATSDAKGAFNVTASGAANVVGKQNITLTVTSAKGLVSQLTEVVTWKPAPTFVITPKVGKFNVTLTNASGLPALVKYGAEKWVLLLVASDSQVVTVMTLKGTYSVTVQIGEVKSSKSVVVR